jgi:hypothetical protein
MTILNNKYGFMFLINIKISHSRLVQKYNANIFCREHAFFMTSNFSDPETTKEKTEVLEVLVHKYIT